MEWGAFLTGLKNTHNHKILHNSYLFIRKLLYSFILVYFYGEIVA